MVGRKGGNIKEEKHRRITGNNEDCRNFKYMEVEGQMKEEEVEGQRKEG